MRKARFRLRGLAVADAMKTVSADAGQLSSADDIATLQMIGVLTELEDDSRAR